MSIRIGGEPLMPVAEEDGFAAIASALHGNGAVSFCEQNRGKMTFVGPELVRIKSESTVVPHENPPRRRHAVAGGDADRDPRRDRREVQLSPERAGALEMTSHR